MTIDILTNDALLEIFDRFLDQARERNKVNLEAWHTLVHVCRKWRIIVPIRSWVELAPICDIFGWMAFCSPNYQNSFHLQLALSIFPFGYTFSRAHFSRGEVTSLSSMSKLGFNLRIQLHALSSWPSPGCSSKALSSIWRTSSLGSKSLLFTPSI